MAGGTLVLAGLALTVLGLIALAWALVHWVSWRAMFVACAIVVVGAWFSVWRYSHRPELVHAECKLPTKVGELGSLCGFNDPEDLEWVPTRGLVIASEERLGGRLLGLIPQQLDAGPFVLWPHDDVVGARIADPIGDPTCNQLPDPRKLYLHGMSVADGSSRGGPIRVAVVAHAERETIQFFDFDATSTKLNWRGCIYYPENTTGNDVALLSDGSLLATNYAPTGAGSEGERYRLRGGVGFNTGDVLAWSSSSGWSHIPHTTGALPNGIAAAKDESEFYFADAGAWRIGIVTRGANATSVKRIHVGGAPDNLSVSNDGRVLAAVVNFGGDLPLLCAVGGRKCHTGWAIWELDPKASAAAEVVSDTGSVLRTASSALQVGSYILIGSMDDDRIGVYRRY